MLRSGSRNELNVASVVDSTVIAVDTFVLLVLPGEPTDLVSLEADLVNVNRVTDDWSLKPELDGILSWWNSILEQLHVNVLHHFFRELFPVVVDLVEMRFVLGSLEEICSIASLPWCVVESN